MDRTTKIVASAALLILAANTLHHASDWKITTVDGLNAVSADGYPEPEVFNHMYIAGIKDAWVWKSLRETEDGLDHVPDSADSATTKTTETLRDAAISCGSTSNEYLFDQVDNLPEEERNQAAVTAVWDILDRCYAAKLTTGQE
ncbi:MAG: hypothetical protein ACR2QL_05325 [Woeseiaceae bacterium]